MEIFRNKGQLEIVVYTLRAVKSINEYEFCRRLYEHTEGIALDENLYNDALDEINSETEYSITVDDDPKNKVRSWIDCIKFIKKAISDEKLSLIGDVLIGFEYHLKKRWVDAVIVCKGKIIILEFKSGKSGKAEDIKGYIKQLRRYYNRIRRGNAEVVKQVSEGKLVIEKYLVFTNSYMSGRIFNGENIIVDKEFEWILNNITGPVSMDDFVKLLDSTKYIDPSISGVLTSFIHKGVIEYVEKDTANVIACNKILHEILESKETTLGITIVKGGPGTGKTGTAFTILEKCLSEGINRIQYVTGNSNLERYFTGIVEAEIEKLKYEASMNHGFESSNENWNIEELEGLGEQLIGHIKELYDTKNYCQRYYDKKDIKLTHINDQVILIDEAQRLWNATSIATSKKRLRGMFVSVFDDKCKKKIYEDKISETYLILFSALQGIIKDNANKNIIMFLGNGQEINSGEEDGERDVLNSIYNINKKIVQDKIPIKLKVYVSDAKTCDTFQKYQVPCEQRPELKLTSNQRNDLGDPQLDIVQAILDGKAEGIGSQTGYEIYNKYEDLLNAIAYNSIEKNSVEGESLGIIISSYDSNVLSQSKVMFKDKELRDAGKDLYKFFYLRESNELNTYVTEFGCQGLEFDDSILIWGRTLLWRGGEWLINTEKYEATNKQGKRYKRSRYIRHSMYVRDVNELIESKKISESEVIDKFVKNAYRVLLTRARETTYIFVEDIETYKHLKNLLGQ
ncbi:MAG: DNA/RNA helicase domain-containing protein [Clostridium sp.]